MSSSSSALAPPCLSAIIVSWPGRVRWITSLPWPYTTAGILFVAADAAGGTLAELGAQLRGDLVGHRRCSPRRRASRLRDGVTGCRWARNERTPRDRVSAASEAAAALSITDHPGRPSDRPAGLPRRGNRPILDSARAGQANPRRRRPRRPVQPSRGDAPPRRRLGSLGCPSPTPRPAPGQPGSRTSPTGSTSTSPRARPSAAAPRSPSTLEDPRATTFLELTDAAGPAADRQRRARGERRRTTGSGSRCTTWRRTTRWSWRRASPTSTTATACTPSPTRPTTRPTSPPTPAWTWPRRSSPASTSPT